MERALETFFTSVIVLTIFAIMVKALLAMVFSYWFVGIVIVSVLMAMARLR